MSLTVALVGLIVCAPILLLVALAIKLDSRGPVFFVQERAGWNGKPFNLFKFRTMHPAGSAPPTSEWVQDNVGRITRVGKWLRRFRLDEVPQMVNVLRGEMNLIGPRPHPTSNQKIFLEYIAYYGLRSTVRPGVTGWAQVRYGYANNLEQETEKMRYDLYYIKNHTLWLDFKILFETVFIMVTGHGAAEVRRQVRRERGRAAARRRSSRRRRWSNETLGARRHRLPALQRRARARDDARRKPPKSSKARSPAAQCGDVYPITKGVPRFVPQDAYAQSFGYQWNWFRTVQLDSINKSSESERGARRTRPAGATRISRDAACSTRASAPDGSPIAHRRRAPKSSASI